MGFANGPGENVMNFNAPVPDEAVLFTGSRLLSAADVTLSNWYYHIDPTNCINPDTNTYSINRYCIIPPSVVPTCWAYVETTKGVYDWAATDTWVNTWNALGKGLTVELGRLPSWANKTLTATDSATSNTIGTGALTFTIAAGQANLSAGSRFYAFSNGTQTATLSGTVTSYSGTTLIVNVTVATGTGTFTDWKISLGYCNLAPTNMDDFASWVQTIGTRYNGKILNWFVRNEPSWGATDSSEWKDSSAKYAEMMRVASQILHNINPANKILACELPTIGTSHMALFTTLCSASAAGFDTGSYIGLGAGTATGLGTGTTAKDWIDIVSFHGYVGSQTGDEIQEFTNIANWNNFKGTMTSLGLSGKPVWNTEYMFINSFFGTEYLRMQRNALISWLVGGCTNFTWFGWGRSASQWKANSAAGVTARGIWNTFMNTMFASPITKLTMNVKTNRLVVYQANGTITTV
jgi:hypothetical protein